jgi:hypothetical protein
MKRLPLVAAAAAALLLVAGASAHRPGFYSEPVIHGELRVGATVIGDENAKACDPACHVLKFQWLLCDQPGGGGYDAPPGGLPDNARPCPGARPGMWPAGSVWKPRSSDPRFTIPRAFVGKYLQLEVFLGANDCDWYGRNAATPRSTVTRARAW